MSPAPHAVRMQKVGSAYISEHAIVCGDVTLGADVSIWPHVAIRGDVAPIRIGDQTNVQDGAIIHCRTGVPLDIGRDVVIGHLAVVHCKRVGDGCLIGIRSVVLDNAEIGDGAIARCRRWSASITRWRCATTCAWRVSTSTGNGRRSRGEPGVGLDARGSGFDFVIRENTAHPGTTSDSAFEIGAQHARGPPQRPIAAADRTGARRDEGNTPPPFHLAVGSIRGMILQPRLEPSGTRGERSVSPDASSRALLSEPPRVAAPARRSTRDGRSALACVRVERGFLAGER
jgi:hypothetical protein